MSARWRYYWAELMETRARVRPELQHKRPSGRSLVAEANALFRASEQAVPVERRIVDDPWAARLVDAHPVVRAVAVARHAVPPLARELETLRVAHCTRHRSLDELALAAYADGYRQFVVVGAGYDMRASRFAEAMPQARWYEVDEPSTLANKQARLRGLRPAPVVAVAADLLAVRALAALDGTDLLLAQPVCWILEGLLHYLPAAAVDTLVAAIAHGTAPRRVLLSCITPQMAARASPAFAALVKLVREVPRRYDDRASLAGRFAPFGVAVTGYWDFAAQVQAFAPQVGDRRVAVSQDVARLDRDCP